MAVTRITIDVSGSKVTGTVATSSTAVADVDTVSFFFDPAVMSAQDFYLAASKLTALGDRLTGGNRSIQPAAGDAASV